jgi:hypothetical protein
MEEKIKQIRNIKNDSNLSENEKNKQIQSIMMSNYSNSCTNLSNLSKTCEHYDKQCYKFYFECCNIYDPCKRCHLERNLDCKNFIIKKITCSKCDIEQEPSEQCINCNIKFSKNFCAICKIWTTNNIYHCDLCGICRIGSKETLFHCNYCNICFNNDITTHKCINDFKLGICVICNDNIFNSQNKSIVFNCKHFAHDNCFNEYVIKGNYKCPHCKKSIVDMNAQWEYLKTVIRNNPIPKDMIPIEINDIVDSTWGKFKILDIENVNSITLYKGEFIDWKISEIKNAKGILNSNNLIKKFYKNIYCNDCEQKSKSIFHYYGLECGICGSFNTQE